MWPPAVARKDATAGGDWSLAARADGTKQWAYGGAPLYRFAHDEAVGDAKGDGTPGWHVAVFHPEAGLALPDAIQVREITDAGGAGLVDSLGMTLYALDGSAAHSVPSCAGGDDCARHWAPLEAPQIANATGDFSVIAHDDGITQWMYRGRPLYRFSGDVKPGDANGAGVDPRFRPSLIRRFFMPADVAIRRTVELGAILATRRGATLYQHDRVSNEELHPFRTDHGSPALGRAFGTATCDRNCTKTWPPLAAPADAISAGYWDVVTRADGARQWAYKGFALHTFAADKPGDIDGHAIYTLAQIGGNPKSAEIDPNALVGGSASGLGVSAMFWHAVVP